MTRSGRATAEGPAPLLELEGVSKRFGPLSVLRGVSLAVRPGEVVALLGENGVGKSTLVGCIGGVVTPDEGLVRLDGAPLPGSPERVRHAGVEVLWQDHGLCDDLDVVTNLFLGRERGRFRLADDAMLGEARAVLQRVGLDRLRLDRQVRGLSRGQRQLLGLGRVVLGHPRVLVLDEPTASLGVVEARRVVGLLRELRAAGAAILLVTHDLDHVFTLADRLAVLRDGRLVADLSPLEVHRDDVVALLSGIETDSMARRQLQRLRSLGDQLSDVEPAASLPLIVSAMAAALDQEMLCVHLVDTGEDGAPVLRRAAAVGLPDAVLAANEVLPAGPGGGCEGLAVSTGEAAIIENLAADPVEAPHLRAALAAGIRSGWATPIVGARGVLGVVSGFAVSVGGPEAALLELARLYLGHAASAIERERLLAEVSRRNAILEALRAMLEALAGPERVEGGIDVALVALRDALGASLVGVLLPERGEVLRSSDGPLGWERGNAPGWVSAALGTLLLGPDDGRAHLVEPDLAAVALRHPEGRALLVARFAGVAPTRDTLELLDDASRSLALAMEGDALEQAKREAAALRRSQGIQRDLLSALSHELRTPLTAIQGFASTLRQPDLTWDPRSTERFLASISSEAARMERLVGALLDSSAIESGVLRLQPHWCDLRLVLEAAVRVARRGEDVALDVDAGVEPIWADHDRLEQVFVNLLENALTHGAGDGGDGAIEVRVERVERVERPGEQAGAVTIEVRDHGPGVDPAVAERIFEPRFRDALDVPGAGLGLPIARGIVEAHGGRLELLARRPGEGATFRVTLPVEGPADAASGFDASWVDQALREDVDA